MNWYKDSLLCLNEAEEIIQQIEELEKNSIHDIELLERCKPKIKNCLENCRSPLDFVSNYLFDTYCKDKYTSNDLKYKRNYYPITYKKHKLYEYLDKNFKGLDSNQHEIVKIIDTTQPFKSNDKWLDSLKTLVNENKHANLTFNTSEKSIDIKKLEFGGVKFTNVTMTNVGVPIRIGNQDYDLINSFPPGSINQDITAKNKISFEELKLPVVETLKQIHKGVSDTINSIEVKL